MDHSSADNTFFSQLLFNPEKSWNVIFLEKAAKSKISDALQSICQRHYGNLSHLNDLSAIQDSCAIRNVLRTRSLAELLIDDKGLLKKELLPPSQKAIEEALFSLGPDRHADSIRLRQILNVIDVLQKEPQAVRLLLAINKPYANPLAEQIIRDTLLLPEKTVVEPFHAKRATLAAWMAFLRQSVGSCFATAPAIIVHDEQYQQFLLDIAEIISTGRLKRTFGGIEYAVPLCVSAGIGDLRRIMEFTYEEVFVEKKIKLPPAIANGLVFASLIDQNLAFSEQYHRTEEMVLQTLQKQYQWAEKVIWTTPENLFEKILANYAEAAFKSKKSENSSSRDSFPGLGLLPLGNESSSLFEITHQKLLERCSMGFVSFAENVLLKSWEFTVASFAETKPAFSKWNLYASLGLDPRGQGGIGNAIYRIIEEEFERSKDFLEELRAENELLVLRINQLVSRINSGDVGSDPQWLKSEYQVKQAELYGLQQRYNQQREKVEGLSNLFNEIIQSYEALFPRYFQEVYDPDIRETTVGPYDDSPAGFHLVYKHGRDNSANWSRVNGPDEFVNHLADFFIATEYVLVAELSLEGDERLLISEIVTAVVKQVKTEEFLETALRRMASAHNVGIVNNPLQNMDKIEKKPWVYTSGGTMAGLVSCYFRREQQPTATSRWVESPLELLVFLIDAVKQLPANESDSFLKNRQKSLLMHSPTHAFLFKPGYSPFCSYWQSNEFTYTLVRDQIVLPQERFVSKIELDEKMMFHFRDKLSLKIPVQFRPYFSAVFSRFFGTMSPIAFREHLKDTMLREKTLSMGGEALLPEDIIDSELYSSLPLFPAALFTEKVRNILSLVPLEKSCKEKIIEGAEIAAGNIPSTYFLDAQQLQDGIMALICKTFEAAHFSQDIAMDITRAAQDLGYALPAPLFFADSNWMRDYFAFVVNPGTGLLDFWRMDSLGRKGSPMAHWRQWLDGSRKERQWGIYIHPNEYKAI